MIAAQGGETKVCDDVSLLPQAREIIEVCSRDDGYILAMDTEAIGISALLLGAGRLSKEQRIDPAVGIWLTKRIGDQVRAGEPLAKFYVDDRSNLDEALQRFESAVRTGEEEPKGTPLIYTKIE